MSELPPITDERRAELRRLDDVAVVAAKAHAAEALGIGLQNRRRITIIFLLAGALYSFGFWRVAETNSDLRASVRVNCVRQQTNSEALSALSDVLRTSGVIAGGDTALAQARADFVAQVKAIKGDGATTVALRELSRLVEGSQRQDAQAPDPVALAKAAEAFTKIADDVEHPDDCGA